MHLLVLPPELLLPPALLGQLAHLPDLREAAPPSPQWGWGFTWRIYIPRTFTCKASCQSLWMEALCEWSAN